MSGRGALVLAVIAEHQAEYGYAPSIRDIRERAGLASTSSVHDCLVRLERQGLLAREHGHARSYRVLTPRPSDGICARPGCGKPVAGKRSDAKWCSRSCTAIAAHLRRWLRATHTEHLADQLGLTEVVAR